MQKQRYVAKMSWRKEKKINAFLKPLNLNSTWLCIICRLSASNHEQFIQVHLCWVQLWLKLWVFVAVAISKATMLWFNENPFPFFLIIIMIIFVLCVSMSVLADSHAYRLYISCIFAWLTFKLCTHLKLASEEN